MCVSARDRIHTVCDCCYYSIVSVFVGLANYHSLKLMRMQTGRAQVDLGNHFSLLLLLLWFSAGTNTLAPKLLGRCAKHLSNFTIFILFPFSRLDSISRCCGFVRFRRLVYIFKINPIHSWTMPQSVYCPAQTLLHQKRALLIHFAIILSDFFPNFSFAFVCWLLLCVLLELPGSLSIFTY